MGLLGEGMGASITQMTVSAEPVVKPEGIFPVQPSSECDGGTSQASFPLQFPPMSINPETISSTKKLFCVRVSQGVIVRGGNFSRGESSGRIVRVVEGCPEVFVNLSENSREQF